MTKSWQELRNESKAIYAKVQEELKAKAELEALRIQMREGARKNAETRNPHGYRVVFDGFKYQIWTSDGQNDWIVGSVKEQDQVEELVKKLVADGEISDQELVKTTKTVEVNRVIRTIGTPDGETFVSGTKTVKETIEIDEYVPREADDESYF